MNAVTKTIVMMCLAVGLVASVATANTINSSTIIFVGDLTGDATSGYTGSLQVVDEEDPAWASLTAGDGVTGFDIYAQEGATAKYSTDTYAFSDSTDVTIANHDAWPTWNVDTQDIEYYSLNLNGTEWDIRYTSGGTWYEPLGGTVDWSAMYATETDLGTGPSFSAWALMNGGGAQAWDVDWSWGSEVVPLEYAGFSVSMQQLDASYGAYDGKYLVVFTPAAGDPVPEPATLSLLGLGLAGLVGRRMRRKG